MRIKRGKQLLDDRNEKKRYRNLDEEAIDHIPRRSRFGRVYGLVRQNKQ